MKPSINFTLTSATPDRGLLRRAVYTFLLGVVAFCAIYGSARAQNLYVGQYSTVSEYSAATGALNTTFSAITGFSYAYGLAVSGNTLYVASEYGGTVGTYNAKTGAPINTNFITGLSYPSALVVSGNNLWVSNLYTGVIGEYNATTGAPVTGSSIVAPCEPTAMAFSGSNLLIACPSYDAISEYNTSTGVAINANFITGLSYPTALVMSGNDLYVLSSGSGVVGIYNLTTGAPINANLITGLSDADGLALSGNDLFVGNLSLGTVGEYNATTGAVIHESFITGVSPVGLLATGSPQTTPCTLTDTVSYNATDSTLTMKFTVGNNETTAVTWSAWLTYQDTITPVFTPISQPVTNPAQVITKTFPDLPAEGTVGVLSTLTTATGGIVCSSFVTAKTATP